MAGKPVLGRPCVVRGEHAVSSEQFMDFIGEHFAHNLRDYGSPEASLAKAREIACGTMGIDTRYFARPVESLLEPLSPQQQAEHFRSLGMKLGTAAIEEALRSTGVDEGDIGAIVMVSHSPFPFPPLTADVLSHFAFKEDCFQIPVTTMGCAGGGFALTVAHDFLTANPRENVLVLSVELCSLGFRPHKSGMSWFLNAALFGDAAAAAVVCGAESSCRSQLTGLAIVDRKQRLVKNTQHVSYFEYDEWGYHFITTQELCHVVEQNCPRFARDLAREAFHKEPKDLALNVIHPGGTRMVKGCVDALGLEGSASEAAAYTSMRNGGNLASATILDMLAERWDTLHDGDAVLAMGMGPGFVMCGVALQAVPAVLTLKDDSDDDQSTAAGSDVAFL